MTAFAITLDHVAIARGERVVLSNVSAAIRAGEFVGVFGPNGAGKTTLLQAILGLVRPSHGSLRVFGAAPARGNPEAGYMPQQRAAVGDLHLRGLDFVVSAVRGERWGPALPGRTGWRDAERTIAMVEAQGLAELSGGELQRLLLAQALVGRPRLLLLDEPLISLDPHFQQAIVALVRRVQQSEGITVLFTAHEVNALLGAMDRVLYLGSGHARLGTVDEVITGDVLSTLYGASIDVLRVDGRIVVVSGHGLVEADAHRHDA
ncbi:MAG TPA: ATP-binding cassette domain-containing protein [Casimicrobiaceae bacterium]